MLHGYMRTQRVVFRCGVLFWDQNRLEDWNVTRGADIEELGRWAAKLYTRYFGSLQKDCEEETRSRQIVEWTRSHVQITFDEFLAKQEGKGQ
ncbi:hypothetical protein [Exiguobacterium sp. SH3S3]|uniref:hypothetical protein n=1 Tax=Exiguobacterium sp. SH3S3 TaxID=2510957 RepID=UPI00103E7482|nr:hypothetical protein [Exiguobacterium sp. SH3S3]TCI41206.1 hypothetical protein EVJ28_13980 [Exiguobacterium sp. SH3S3]